MNVFLAAFKRFSVSELCDIACRDEKLTAPDS
jgi:hypothetical protein